MNGNEWERTLLKYLDNFCKNEKCYFFKSQTPTIMRKINGKYTLVYSQKAICDFIGISNETFVLIEAKSINNKYWDTRRLKNHQKDQLLKIQKLGGISLIIFYIKLIDKVLIIPIDEYLLLKEETNRQNININILINNGKIVENKIDSVKKLFESIFLT